MEYCLQNRKTEQLIQFLERNGVYMATENEAEQALDQQLLAFGKPKWETYKRWRFPDGIPSSTDSLGASCAACYNAPRGSECCKGIFQLRKLVLKPFQYQQHRVSSSFCDDILLLTHSYRYLPTKLMPKIRMQGLYSSARDAMTTPFGSLKRMGHTRNLHCALFVRAGRSIVNLTGLTTTVTIPNGRERVKTQQITFPRKGRTLMFTATRRSPVMAALKFTKTRGQGSNSHQRCLHSAMMSKI
jgi:hypothetical protein